MSDFEIGVALVVSAVAAYVVYRGLTSSKSEDETPEYNVEVPYVATLEELNAMTKVQIDEYAAGFGLKLDRRWAKKRMINECIANGLVRE